MPPPEQDRNEQRSFWHEIQPLVRHAGAVLVLELSLLVIGLGALGLGKLFPEQKGYLTWIELLDILLFFTLLSMFGVYTIVIVAVRLFGGLKGEVGRINRRT